MTMKAYKDNTSDWFPNSYKTGINSSTWIDLLNDKSVVTQDDLKIFKRLLDMGGQATCTQLSQKYGWSASSYKNKSVALAQRVRKKTKCHLLKDENHKFMWWPILYVGKKADSNSIGEYIWKLRDELKDALRNIDMTDIELYSKSTKDENRDEKAKQYWWLNANPKIWSFSNFKNGEVQTYTLLNESGNKRRIYQNFLDAKVGDLVIGYESYPVKKIVALARIQKEQDGEYLYFEKIENLSTPIDYQTLKSYPELEKMEYFTSPQGSLFKLTEDEFEFIMTLIREENPILTSKSYELYTKKEFLSDVYMSEEKYQSLVSVLENKKNIILQGAPGVGKTFTAKRLAYSLMGEKDDNRIEFVQFHQNYSYEDFVMGYKPDDTGFVMKYGIFYRFCQKAENNQNQNYYFIIDEINRGNLSKIFGELLMLIENNYRGVKATLAYNGQPFSIPENLYIIGMMNTADRSLAMIDYALRRRFSFFQMDPGFDTEGFIKYQNGLNNEHFNDLIQKVKELNLRIASDKSLGKGFCIGHSYFCGKTQCDDVWLQEIVDYDILPMLSEYWFDDDNEVQKWASILHGVFK